MIAQITMMLFCMDTFCFLNVTIMTSFFVSMAAREKNLDLEIMYKRLGPTYHWPDVYFRVGYVLMVASLCGFFVLMMQPWRMMGCLIFCITFIIVPMTYAMVQSLLLTVPSPFSGSIDITEANPFRAQSMVPFSIIPGEREM